MKEVHLHSQNPARSCKALQIDGEAIIRVNAFDMELENYFKNCNFWRAALQFSIVSKL